MRKETGLARGSDRARGPGIIVKCAWEWRQIIAGIIVKLSSVLARERETSPSNPDDAISCSPKCPTCVWPDRFTQI